MTPRLVLIIGSPRSGTTWLQSLLGSHAAIATPQETDLFRLYLEPLVNAWDGQLGGLQEEGSVRRRKGLPTVLTTAQFDELCRAFVSSVVESVHALKPAASVVLEKSPGHSMSTAVVQRLRPDASFIHVIRDGRDVAASLTAASRTFGGNFAPSDVAGAAALWTRRVAGARGAAAAPGGYTEIRYEELQHDGAPTLQRAFAACGLDVSTSECASIIERFRFESVAESGAVAESILTGGEVGDDPKSRAEPPGFFRRGKVGGWREDWGEAERRAFDGAAGALLVELGYEPDRSWAGTHKTGPKPVAAGARFTARALRGLSSRIDRAVARRNW